MKTTHVEEEDGLNNELSQRATPPSVLSGTRLQLRPLAEGDSDAIFAIRSLEVVYQWRQVMLEDWIRPALF